MRDAMRKTPWLRGLLYGSAGLALAGCAVRAPAGPTVMALPAQGETFALFQQHDGTCRQYASSEIGGRTPGQTAAAAAVGRAVLGTGIGAAAGALIGSASGHAGTGAAIGGGTGLITGSLLGGLTGRRAAAGTQTQYNNYYAQCMVAHGERIAPPAAPPPALVYAVPPPSVIYTPAYVVPPPPPPPVPRPGSP